MSNTDTHTEILTVLQLGIKSVSSYLVGAEPHLTQWDFLQANGSFTRIRTDVLIFGFHVSKNKKDSQTAADPNSKSSSSSGFLKLGNFIKCTFSTENAFQTLKELIHISYIKVYTHVHILHNKLKWYYELLAGDRRCF